MVRRKKKDTPFRHQLIALMRERNMTVRKAATIAEVGAATIVDWRSGSSPADFMAVKRLADALGVSMAYLLTGGDDLHAMNVRELFNDGGTLFDGYAEIKIKRLVPKITGKSE